MAETNPELMQQAQMFAGNFDVGKKLGDAINTGVKLAGQAAEAMGVPGASMVGDTLSGNQPAGGSGISNAAMQGMNSSGGSPMGDTSAPAADTATSGNGSGGGFPGAIDATSRVAAPKTAAKTPALEPGAASIAGVGSTVGAAGAIPPII